MRMKHFFDHYLRGKKDLLSVFNFFPSYLGPEARAQTGRQQKKSMLTLKLLKQEEGGVGNTREG